MSQPSTAPLLDQPDTDTSIDEAFKNLTGYEEKLDDGADKDRFSHYASKDEIIRSAVEGVAITALCGKQWKPSRSPEKYPICPECKDIYEGMDPGEEE